MTEVPDPTPMGPDDLASIAEWGHAGYDLALESEAYQALLEGHRADPGDEHIYQDMLKARAAMEVAWLQHTQTR